MEASIGAHKDVLLMSLWSEIQPRGARSLTTQTPEATRKRSFLLTGAGWPYLLVPLIPVAILLELVHADAVLILAASAPGVNRTRTGSFRRSGPLAATLQGGVSWVSRYTCAAYR
jgi:Ca2+:H+ antiporter